MPLEDGEVVADDAREPAVLAGVGDHRVEDAIAGYVGQADAGRVEAERRELGVNEGQVAGPIVAGHRHGAVVLTVRVGYDHVLPGIAVDVPDGGEADIGAVGGEVARDGGHTSSL